MQDVAIFWDWLSFAARWLHVITAIAWIGSSFYFIALDLGLRQRPGLPAGAHGEEWQVHGGGFYHIQKYLVAPAEMPEHLTWFKCESYFTWMSGFALLCIVYYGGADLYLIDRNVLDVSAPVAILISLASLGLGWLVYDLLCKSRLGDHDTLLMLLLYGVVVLLAWGFTQLFTGRAAFLHLGALTAVFCFFSLEAVINAAVVVRIVIQFLGQIVGLAILRRTRPDVVLPFRMWLYPVPAVLAAVGWMFVLAARYEFLPVSLAVIGSGVVVYPIWRRVVAAAMEDCDLLLTAAQPAEAVRIEAVGKWASLEKPGFTMPFNVTGQPAIAVPCGLGEGGLPVAVQLAARPFEDALLLRAAHALEAALDTRGMRPALAEG